MLFRSDQTGEKDPRRHKGFSIFYATLNLGEVVAAVSAGYLVKYIAWNGVYVTAAVGLIVGTAIFFFGMRFAKIRDQEHKITPFKIVFAYAISGLLIIGADVVLGSPTLAWYLFGAVVTGAVLVGLLRARYCTPVQAKRLAGFYILSLMSIVFWAMFFLIYSVLNLYILRVVDHHFAGYILPVPVYGGIESLGVVLLGPLMGIIWLRLRQRGMDLSTPSKFALGFVFMTITMGILYLATSTAGGNKVASAWLVFAYFVLAAGELSLSAIGLSMVTEYVPKHMTGMMMGVWYVCTGLGGKLSGLFADAAAIPKNIHNLTTMESLYDNAFLMYFLVSAGAILVSLVMAW